MFVIKVYGQTRNYYVGSLTGFGVKCESNAHRFATEIEARAFGQMLFAEKKIGHWEVRSTASVQTPVT